MNIKEFFEFDQDDKKMWLGFGAVGLIYIIAFTLFGGGLFQNIERFVFFLLEDILPGYVIMKLFMDKIALSDNKIADRLMVSFAVSLGVMEVPFYLLKYLRPYESNTDEKAWGAVSDTTVTLLLLIVVFGVAFGLKYYLTNKKNPA